MRSAWSRICKLLGFIFRPIPDWYDRGQTVVTVIITLLPSGVPLLYGAWNWAFRRGLAFSGIIFVLLLFLACYRLQKQFENAMDAIPKLSIAQCTYYATPIFNMQSGGIVGLPTFYHANIINEPRGIADRKLAKNVAGRVQIKREDGSIVCKYKLHRWEHAPEFADVGRKANLSQHEDLLPNGIEYKLDIAMKYDNEECFYTPTNDSAVSNHAPGFRDKRYEFSPGIYIAEIRLSGENVDTYLKCRIINPGQGNLILTPLT